MSKSPLDYLEHICLECAFVARHIEGLGEEDFMRSEILQRAVCRSIEIIGEATKQIDEDFRAKHPHIEWKKMAGMRNLIIHHYFGIDYGVVWDVASSKMPDLFVQLRRIQQQ